MECDADSMLQPSAPKTHPRGAGTALEKAATVAKATFSAPPEIVCGIVTTIPSIRRIATCERVRALTRPMTGVPTLARQLTQRSPLARGSALVTPLAVIAIGARLAVRASAARTALAAVIASLRVIVTATVSALASVRAEMIETTAVSVVMIATAVSDLAMSPRTTTEVVVGEDPTTSDVTIVVRFRALVQPTRRIDGVVTLMTVLNPMTIPNRVLMRRRMLSLQRPRTLQQEMLKLPSRVLPHQPQLQWSLRRSQSTNRSKPRSWNLVRS